MNRLCVMERIGDGFALWDAMCGLLPELRLPRRGENKEEFYSYNQN